MARLLTKTQKPFFEIAQSWWCHQMETFPALTGPLCGEFTGQRWLPLSKVSDAELWCFLWSGWSWTNGWVSIRKMKTMIHRDTLIYVRMSVYVFVCLVCFCSYVFLCVLPCELIGRGKCLPPPKWVIVHMLNSTNVRFIMVSQLCGFNNIPHYVA